MSVEGSWTGGRDAAGYDVVHRVIEAGDMAVEMCLVADPNRLAVEVSQADFAADERFPYWAELWPSAIGLGEFLADRGGLYGVGVVELGSGMGFAGVVAALLRARVIFTDFEPDALVFASINHELNLGEPGTTRVVDWRTPPSDLTASLVIGADVVYEGRFIAPLLDTLRAVVAPGGAALIAEPDRDIAREAFAPLEAEGWHHELHLVEPVIRGRSHQVWIHELGNWRGESVP